MQFALAAFNGDLDKVRQVITWLGAPENLSPSRRQMVDAISSGCLILLCGYFESFVRECMEGFIDEVNALGKAYSKLPTKMQYKHFETGSRVLLDVARADKREKIVTNVIDVVSRLASVANDSTYSLLREAFSQTYANPGPGVISQLLKDVGVSEPWPSVNKAAPGFGNLEVVLEAFIGLRNECAHTGSTKSPPTPSELDGYSNNLAAIGQGMVIVLKGAITELAKP